MRKHLGKREREARKLMMVSRRRGRTWNYSISDSFGEVTLKLGRKKFSEIRGNSLRLKKKFPGCVVDAER